MTRFLFERQQLPDGSMPRNSLTNGKPAPDSFNTQLDECAYPLVMALAVGLTGQQYYEDHIKPAANFVATRGPSFGPERWEEQSGFSPSTISAEIAGLLAAAQDREASTATTASARVWRATADEFQRNLKALDAHDQRPAQPRPVLHPPVEERRPERGRRLQRRQRRADARPARDHRRRLPRVRAPRRARRGRPRPRALARRRRRDDPPHAPTPATASTATTATATATAPPTGTRGRPRTWATATCGRCWPASAASGSSTAATSVRRVGRLEAMHGTALGVGLIPEQAWELADLARSPFGTDPDDGVDRLRERQGRRLGRGADVVGRPVRAPDARRVGRARARPPALHDAALRQAHAGRDRR